MKNIIIAYLVICLIIPFSSAAHYIVGIVNDAKDGQSSNGLTVTLWNPTNGLSDNFTDVVGPSGNSGADNIYMIDCEMLDIPCDIWDNLSVKVFNNGNDYVSDQKNVTVAGLGFDVVENLSLNSPPFVESVLVDDSFIVTPNEIDLFPATTANITCRAIVTEYDGESSITNGTSMFFDNVLSGYGDSYDNNEHYSNNSCYINYSYGTSNQVEIICNFSVWYYANSQNWNCTVNVTDNISISSLGSDLSFINPLLALGVDSPINFGLINATTVSDELELNVTNYGNVPINLSLSGYGASENDGNSMNCTLGSTKNISIYYEKYNLTSSNPGNLDLGEFGSLYSNLTSAPLVKKFDLNYRQDDLTNEAVNLTYWRIYVPPGVAGSCQGNIVFGAAQSDEG